MKVQLCNIKSCFLSSVVQLVLMVDTCLFAVQVEPAALWVLCPIQQQFYVVFLSVCLYRVFL